MPVITLQFPRSQYPSLQVGDTAYYVKMDTPTAGFQINDNAEDFVEMGTVTAIDNSTSLSNGTLTTSGTWATHVKAVKDANPKPS